MNVGFYYHVEGVFDGRGGGSVPSYLGVFVDELAKQAGGLTYYLHGAPATGVDPSLGRPDYPVGPPYVRCIDIGPRRSFPARTFRPGPALRSFRPQQDGVDVMLVRGPTPLLPSLVRACGDVPVALLLVGRYTVPVQRPSTTLARRLLIPAWVRLYELEQRRAARRALVLANSPELAGLLRKRYHLKVHEVFTSSLTAEMVRAAAEARDAAPGDIGRDRPARLVFTGRIIREKGLFEAIRAVEILRERGYNATLDLLGWENPTDATVDELLSFARQRGLHSNVAFRGYVPAGRPLLEALAAYDVYVMPGYVPEGFPRALTEAMAAGLPVVATRVGGIPARLEDRRQALLVEPASPVALADAIQELIDKPEKRRDIAEDGRAWAAGMTNEASCALILERLRAYVSK